MWGVSSPDPESPRCLGRHSLCQEHSACVPHPFTEPPPPGPPPLYWPVVQRTFPRQGMRTVHSPYLNEMM